MFKTAQKSPPPEQYSGSIGNKICACIDEYFVAKNFEDIFNFYVLPK